LAGLRAEGVGPTRISFRMNTLESTKQTLRFCGVQRLQLPRMCSTDYARGRAGAALGIL
jgi:hypothetical protein